MTCNITSHIFVLTIFYVLSGCEQSDVRRGGDDQIDMERIGGGSNIPPESSGAGASDVSDLVGGAPAGVEPIGGDPASGELMGGDSAGAEPLGGDEAGSELMGGDSAGSEPMGGEPAGSDPMGGEPAGSDPMGGEPAGSDPMGGGPTGSDPMGGEPAGSEPMSGEPAGDDPMGGEPAGSEPMSGEPAGDDPMGGEPAGEPAGEIPEPEAIGYNLCGLGAGASRALGTFDEPIIATYSPFVDRNDTSTASQDLYRNYDCAPDRREYGREVVYRFTMPSAGYFRAEVVDPQGVDIDLHLLQTPTVNANGLVTGCLDRDDRLIEVTNLAAGDYYLVADSWTNASGFEYEGSYTIAFEWLPLNEWTEAPISSGVTLKRRLGLIGDAQKLTHVIIADPEVPVMTRRHSGCATVNQTLESAGARVGINANFFTPSQGCDPTDFLRVDNQTLSLNETTMFPQRTLGWTSDQALRAAWVGYQSDWAEVERGVGGYPSLVINGQVAVEVEPGVPVYSATDWSDQPRSALGITDQGQVILAVVDGRNALSSGLFNQTWAEWLHTSFSLREAIGLDGGGSSTLSVQDCWLNDVVSFPSDGGGVSHQGARAVGSGLYIFP